MKPYSQLMLETASRSREHLDNYSRSEIVNFLLKKINSDGGFQDRAGNSDLYYTMFGISSLLALGVEYKKWNMVDKYVESQTDLSSLDFIHLASLVRCKQGIAFAKLPNILKGKVLQFGKNIGLTPFSKTFTQEITTHLEKSRASAGGFNQNVNDAEYPTSYASFLADSLYSDMGIELKGKQKLINSLSILKTEDGGYSNEPDSEATATSTSAATVLLLTNNQKIAKSTTERLLSFAHPKGGFKASDNTPVPDLLSTASALHPLSLLQTPLDNIKPPTIDFIESAWQTNGGFSAGIYDTTSDCEYTFYALLALGSLL